MKREKKHDKRVTNIEFQEIVVDILNKPANTLVSMI